MSVQVHFRAFWSLQHELFVVSVMDERQHMNEQEFERFIQSIRDPLRFGEAVVHLGPDAEAKVRDYFNKVLFSYRRSHHKNRTK